MFLKCFQEPLVTPNLLQMKHLTTGPLKHQDTDRQGTEGGEHRAAQHTTWLDRPLPHPPQ